MSNRKIQIEEFAFEKFRRFCFWTTDPNNLHDHGTMLVTTFVNGNQLTATQME